VKRLAGLIKEFHLYPDQVRRTGLLDAARGHAQTSPQVPVERRRDLSHQLSKTIPQQAQAVAARAAEMLLEVHRTWRTQDVVKTQQFFDAQKRVAEEVLRAREMEFTQFLARHPRWPWPWERAPWRSERLCARRMPRPSSIRGAGLVSRLEARAPGCAIG